MSSVNLNVTAGVKAVDLKSMDIETALMFVQANRAQEAEKGLRMQMEVVQANNDKIAKLNALLGSLNKAAGSFSSDAKAGTRIDDKKNGIKDYFSGGRVVEREVNDALIDAGYNDGGMSTEDERYGGGVTNKPGDVHMPGGLRAEVTKGKIEAMIQQVKGKIDSLSNSQQMDMLRLQSLTNKRNEAYEIMTNFMKKAQDSKSSVIGNMR